MSIAFECAQCHKRYHVADELGGKRGRCKQCGFSFTIPFASEPAAEEIYDLGSDSHSRGLPDEEPLPTAKRKKKREGRASGLFGLSALPLWGFNVYRGAIAVLLPIALLIGGVPKFAVAMAGVVLCVWPFVASGFAYRFGVAFRDGPIAGLLYMFFMPYRIHYRLTHRELFKKLRAPSLTLRDFSLLLLGLCFLPAVIFGAKEMDKQARNQPPAIDWAHFGPGVKINPPTPPKHHVKAPVLGFGRRPPRDNAPPAPATAESAKTEPDSSATAPAEPAAPESSAPRVADAETKPAQPTPSRPPANNRSRFGRGLRPPMPSGKFAPLGSEPAPPGETLTLNVLGARDAEAKQRVNKAIIAIMKPLGGNWRVSFSNIGEKTIFTVSPVADPKAFADKIDFGKVTQVENRTIDVEIGP
jgi:hypothetical protein